MILLNNIVLNTTNVLMLGNILVCLLALKLKKYKYFYYLF